MKNYIADTKITKGLYITTDSKKVAKNCKNFKLKKPINLLNIAKKDKIAIITVRTPNKKYIQFNVKWTFNIKEIGKINNEYICNDVKLMILEAHKLTQYTSHHEWVFELTNKCLT